MSTHKSNRRWLHEHFNDPYVKQAQYRGFRSRAIYKLLELHERDKLFKPGMTVIDLGATPGSWSQLAVNLVGKQGRVFALDRLPMAPLSGVKFILGDFTQPDAKQELLKSLGETKADWVLSDMAPNMSGVDSVDQARSLELAELAFDLARHVLHEQGGFLVKVFQGEGFDVFLKTLRHTFKTVLIRKPKASKNRSREVYLLAK